jgi:hypothetical protein
VGLCCAHVRASSALTNQTSLLGRAGRAAFLRDSSDMKAILAAMVKVDSAAGFRCHAPLDCVLTHRLLVFTACCDSRARQQGMAHGCGCVDLDRKHETHFAQLRRCFVWLACGFGRASRRPHDYFCYVSQDEVSLATERQARGQGAGGDSTLKPLLTGALPSLLGTPCRHRSIINKRKGFQDVNSLYASSHPARSCNTGPCRCWQLPCSSVQHPYEARAPLSARAQLSCQSPVCEVV